MTDVTPRVDELLEDHAGRAVLVHLDPHAPVWLPSDSRHAGEELDRRDQFVRRALDVDALKAGDERTERSWRLGRQNPPAVDQRHAVTYRFRLHHVMRRQQDRSAFALELRNQRAKLARGKRVHAGGRLVEKEHACVAHQAACQVEALLHAARKLFDALVGALRQPDALEQDCRALLDRGAAQSVERSPVFEVLARREARVQPAFAAEHDADQRPHGFRLCDDVVAADECPARRRQQHGREDLDERRLAGTVRPEQPVHLAGRDRQRDAVERGHGLAFARRENTPNILYVDGLHAPHSSRPLRRRPKSTRHDFLTNSSRLVRV